jgi:hypothetical protein
MKPGERGDRSVRALPTALCRSRRIQPRPRLVVSSSPTSGEDIMRRDWIFGFGAVSTLAVLVGIDLLLALVKDRSLAASHALLRGLGSKGGLGSRRR